MLTDKDIKKKYKAEFYSNSDKYYATGVLKEEGFMRKLCKTCQKPFWSVDPDREVCGDAACSGGFQFIGGTPVKKKMDYVETWKEFARLFSKWGYTPIDRYPVVARWRDDTDFVQASIYDFQPYVVSGEVAPPANPLVVPQFSLRFNDIDNVGITGAHYVGFVMIGQHAFVPPSEWDQSRYFTDIHNWLKEGLGLPNEEITFHEDAWAGGGNFGPCMEYFSRGLELGNQVYMTNEVMPNGTVQELKLKVLDMGMGHERNAWFTQGTSTSYETTFPTVMKKMFSATGMKVDKELMQKFLPYSAYLNVDEIDDVTKAWNDVASSIGYESGEALKEKILPFAGLCSVAEHSRALLFALSDGALPSNVGGGYNLRIILRRALSFIDKYEWDVYMPDICNWHAEYLKEIFPEVSDNLDIVRQILDVEKQKYENTKQKSSAIIKGIIKEDIGEEKLVELYDSQGISPEIIREEADKLGRKVDVPADFYTRVAERHAKIERDATAGKEDRVEVSEGIEDTESTYYDDYSEETFEAKIAFANDVNVILDTNKFYPTSGGQEHDIGKLVVNGEEVKVVDVKKQGGHVIMIMEKPVDFKEGDSVKGIIDMERRRQLAQHHTATHIINAAARRVLGRHINQAGAKKTAEKAHLDVTHFESISKEHMKEIEDVANKIVSEAIPIRKEFMSRDAAEKEYGVNIYQGGAVPGKTIRIVEIPEVDVEACAGTHLNNTSETGVVKILKTSKIQDGIVRIVFTAGKAALECASGEEDILKGAADLLGIEIEKVPSRCEELFSKWKKSKKILMKIGKKATYVDLIKSGEVDADLELTSDDVMKGEACEILSKVSGILKTQPEHISKTLQRFLGELEKNKLELAEKLK